MYETYRLQKLIDSPFSEIIQEKMQRFRSLNADVEDFIKNKAVDYEKRWFSKTYLVINEKAEIIAYFTLALKTLFFTDEVSNSKKKYIHGLTNKITNVPVILIGQLSKNLEFNDEISGGELLELALKVIYEIRELIGGRICLVETLADDSNEKVMDFYLRNDFIKLQTDDDGTYQQLIRKL